jgi:hypothetical protein
MERSENEEDNPVLGAIVVEDLEAPSPNARRNKPPATATLKPTSASSPALALYVCAALTCGVMLGAIGAGLAFQLYLDQSCVDMDEQPPSFSQAAVQPDGTTHGRDNPSTAPASCATMSECIHGTCVMLEGSPAWCVNPPINPCRIARSPFQRSSRWPRGARARLDLI